MTPCLLECMWCTSLLVMNTLEHIHKYDTCMISKTYDGSHVLTKCFYARHVPMFKQNRLLKPRCFVHLLVLLAIVLFTCWCGFHLQIMFDVPSSLSFAFTCSLLLISDCFLCFCFVDSNKTTWNNQIIYEYMLIKNGRSCGVVKTSAYLVCCSFGINYVLKMIDKLPMIFHYCQLWSIINMFHH